MKKRTIKSLAGTGNLLLEVFYLGLLAVLIFCILGLLTDELIRNKYLKTLLNNKDILFKVKVIHRSPVLTYSILRVICRGRIS